MNVLAVDIDKVRRELRYDPETGIVTRKVRSSNRINIGDRVGTLNNRGYLSCHFDGKHYLVHRLVWAHYYGYNAENFIDHINRVRNDNRIENLREVAHTCNIRNSGNRKDSTSGVKGVTRYKPRDCWVARISVNGKRRPVKYTKDFTEAVCYRLAAEQCLDWGSCDSSSSAYQYLKAKGVI